MDEWEVPVRLAAELGKPKWVELGLLPDRNDIESDIVTMFWLSVRETSPLLLSAPTLDDSGIDLCWDRVSKPGAA